MELNFGIIMTNEEFDNILQEAIDNKDMDAVKDSILSYFMLKDRNNPKDFWEDKNNMKLIKDRTHNSGNTIIEGIVTLLDNGWKVGYKKLDNTIVMMDDEGYMYSSDVVSKIEY